MNVIIVQLFKNMVTVVITVTTWWCGNGSDVVIIAHHYQLQAWESEMGGLDLYKAENIDLFFEELLQDEWCDAILFLHCDVIINNFIYRLVTLVDF